MTGRASGSLSLLCRLVSAAPWPSLAPRRTFARPSTSPRRWATSGCGSCSPTTSRPPCETRDVTTRAMTPLRGRVMVGSTAACRGASAFVPRDVVSNRRGGTIADTAPASRRERTAARPRGAVGRPRPLRKESREERSMAPSTISGAAPTFWRWFSNERCASASSPLSREASEGPRGTPSRENPGGALCLIDPIPRRAPTSVLAA